MAISFPSNPTTNQSYTYGSKTWVYNGARWVSSGASLGQAIPTANSIPGNSIIDSTITSTQLSSGLTFSGVTTLGAVGNVKLTGGSSGQFIKTDGTGNLTFTGVQGSDITGQVANSLIAGTVYTNAQPNITSTGTLTTLTMAGLVAETFVTKTNATGTVVHDVSAASTFYHTTPSASFTANFTNVPTTSSKILVIVVVIAQGATAYVPTTMQIDGTTQTVTWLGGTAPSGSANKYDMISYNLFRVGSSWSVFGSASSFG